MRSGIMAATVPISRVRIIAGATSYSRPGVRSNGQALRNRFRLHEAARVSAQQRQPLPVTGTQVRNEPTRGFHQLGFRRHVVEPHDVAELVQDRRALVPRFGPARWVGILRVEHDPAAHELPWVIRSRQGPGNGSECVPVPRERDVRLAWRRPGDDHRSPAAPVALRLVRRSIALGDLRGLPVVQEADPRGGRDPLDRLVDIVARPLGRARRVDRVVDRLARVPSHGLAADHGQELVVPVRALGRDALRRRDPTGDGCRDQRARNERGDERRAPTASPRGHRRPVDPLPVEPRRPLVRARRDRWFHADHRRRRIGNHRRRRERRAAFLADQAATLPRAIDEDGSRLELRAGHRTEVT
jgi:hypothetical protein